MSFNSYIFILALLPITVIGYFALNKIRAWMGKLFIISASVAFYLYGNWRMGRVLLVSLIINYTFGILISRLKHKRILLAAAVMSNVGILLYYKYFNFMLLTAGTVLDREFQPRDITLPLGISFFTFQQIMYLVFVYNAGSKSLLDYVLFVLYFPKLLMGPLTDPEEFWEQVNDAESKRINWDHIANGLRLFSYGLFKKMVIADTFARAVSWGFGNTDAATAMDLFLVMLSYTFEIYFDFSGYCDMAVGISGMLNIKLPINFDSPYKSVSIRDFWKSWHISLTSFFTKYIYIPLGGSRKGRIRTYINTMVVFLISGIWHGANWTFVLWGAIHGILSVLDRIFDKQERRLNDAFRWSVTFLEVNILWLLFRAESITQWKNMLIKMFSFQSMAVSDGLISSFAIPESTFIFDMLHLAGLNGAVRGLPMLIFFIAAYIICMVPENNYVQKERQSRAGMVIASVTFVWAFLCLSSESVFVYFGF